MLHVPSLWFLPNRPLRASWSGPIIQPHLSPLHRMLGKNCCQKVRHPLKGQAIIHTRTVYISIKHKFVHIWSIAVTFGASLPDTTWLLWIGLGGTKSKDTY